MASSFENAQVSDVLEPAEATEQAFLAAFDTLQPFVSRLETGQAAGQTYPLTILGSEAKLSVYCMHGIVQCLGEEPKPMNDLYMGVSIDDKCAVVGLYTTRQTKQATNFIAAAITEVSRSLPDDEANWLQAVFGQACCIQKPGNLAQASAIIEKLIDRSPFPRTDIICSGIDQRFHNGTKIDGKWLVMHILNEPKLKPKPNACQLLVREPSDIQHDYELTGRGEHLLVASKDMPDGDYSPSQAPYGLGDLTNEKMVGLTRAITDAVRSREIPN